MGWIFVYAVFIVSAIFCGGAAFLCALTGGPTDVTFGLVVAAAVFTLLSVFVRWLIGES